MSASLIGTLISWIIVAVIAIAIIFWILRALYRRSTKETAFVRTGLFGEKVVIDGGAFVWPMVHNTTLVNMNTLQLVVSRTNEQALITKDRMRVDVEADFYVRVRKSKDAVSSAATTLGARTMKQESLLALLSGKFVSSLREIAAEMTMEEIHEQRSDYVSRVKAAALDALAENGLELESVAITEFDQTGLEYFNPSNRFDAEGLTHLISDIEERRKTRNDIEQSASVAIRSRNLEAEKRANEIAIESENSRLAQEREIERLRAEQRMVIAREKSERSAEAEAAQLTAAEATETRRIAQERAVSEARIASELDIRRREIERQREIDAAEIELHKTLEIERIAQEEALSIARIGNEAKVRAEQIATEQETRSREIARERAEQEEAIAAEKAVEAARIAREQKISEERIKSEAATRQADIAREREVEEAELAKTLEIDRQRIDTEKERETLMIAQAESLRAAEIARDQALEQLEIDRTRALREAEIASREEVERARIASERGLDEARITQERDRRAQEIARDQALESAELDKAIAIATKSLDESAAQIEAEAARARVAAAEEEVLSARATEEANRRRKVELTLAEKDAEAAKLRAAGEEVEAKVRAEAQRLIYEAENILTDDARSALFRRKMLEHVEGIISASVKPMEKIGDIRIMQLSGMGEGAGGAGRNMTDEVIDSALRYRVQAPMIDQLLSEIGVEGGSLTKMGGLIREARDIDSISKSAEAKKSSDKDKS